MTVAVLPQQIDQRHAGLRFLQHRDDPGIEHPRPPHFPCLGYLESLARHASGESAYASMQEEHAQVA